MKDRNDRTFWASVSAWVGFSIGLPLGVALALTADGCRASAQWGTRSGAVAPLVIQQPRKTTLEWVTDRSAPGQIDLVADGWKLVGAYCPETGLYRRVLDYRRGLWSEPEALPEDVPLPPGGVIEPITQNFGVETDKLRVGGEQAKLGDKEISREEAYNVIENGLPDDAHKLRLTVIGSDEDRKRAENALKAATDIAAACVLTSVPADHWWLKDIDTKKPAFKVDGKPTVYLQAPDGKVLWRQDDDANLIENLRNAKKPYDPAKDPGPSSLVPGLPELPLPVWILGGALLLAFLTRSKEAT